jgi:plasmid replication initiation protein
MTQLNFYVPVASDIAAKNLTDLMQRSWFHLGKRKRVQPIEHKVDEDYVRITAPAETGIANIYDQDVLLYGISQLRHDLNQGKPFDPTIRFVAADYFEFTGRRRLGSKAGGAEFKRLWDSLQRLQSTSVITSLRNVKHKRQKSFSWVNEVEQCEDLRTGRHLGYQMKLPDWITQPIRKDKPDILTINPEYFKLESGVERFLYQFVRKSTGYRDEDHGWFESVDNLYAKSASTGTKNLFWHRLVKSLEKRDFKLLEYNVKIVQIGRKRGLEFHRSKFFPKTRYPLAIEHTRLV